MRRNKYSEETKLAIVLEGLKHSSSIAAICRKHGISDALYYRWRDQFLEGGRRALAGQLESADRALKQRLAEYEKLIGKQTIQLEVLKKTFPD